MKRVSKGTMIFRITYFVMTAILLTAIFSGLYYLYNVLADYEQCLPEKVVENYMIELSSGNYYKFFENAEFSQTRFEDDDVFRRTYISLLNNEPDFSKISKESTDSAPVYRIKFKDTEIAKVYLEARPQKSKFGFLTFEVDKVVLNDLETYSLTITAPSVVDVFLNGRIINSEFVTAQTEAFPETKHFYDYITSIPQMLTYKIDGLLDTVEITAKDMFGNQLKVGEDNTITMPAINDEELTNLAIDFCTVYSEYTLNDNSFSAVAEYVAPDVVLYETMKNYTHEYIAWHTGYEFSNITAGDLIFYSSECFSVNIKYDHIILSHDVVVLPIDYTVYFAMTDDKVLVTDLIMR